MDQIAERAGVSKPVLYQHFPGKRELYVALLDAELTSLEERLIAAVSDTEDNRERVNATVRTFFEFVAQDSSSHRLVFSSDLANDPDVALRLKTFERVVGEAIGDVVRAQAGLPAEAANLLGHALAGAAQTGARQWVLEQSVPLEDAVQLVSRLAWRGIGWFPKDSPEA